MSNADESGNELIGIKGIADRTGAHPNNVHRWRRKGVLPPPDDSPNGRPAWSAKAIDSWWEQWQQLPLSARRGRRADPFWEIEIGG